MGASRIRLLIVDDSALVRRVLTDIFAQTPDIAVVGVAQDPFVARDEIKRLNPDVLTLDVEMPRMDGVTFLGNLMRLRPMPVVMISSLTEKGATVTLRALEHGAVDFVVKPKFDAEGGLEDFAAEIIAKVRMAASVRVRPLERREASVDARPEVAQRNEALPAVSSQAQFCAADRVIGIGASTGGTEALKQVLAGLSSNMPGIVISQHIPAAFSEPFARRLDGLTSLTVTQAGDRQPILPDHVYVAPGGRHLRVERAGARYVCRLNDGPAVNRHKPSVDVMMLSLAQSAGPSAIGVMLTGMGMDGVAGIDEMKCAGASILAQDEKTSIVWGMPGEVVKRGLADEVLPLGEIGPRLLQLVHDSPLPQHSSFVAD